MTERLKSDHSATNCVCICVEDDAMRRQAFRAAVAVGVDARRLPHGSLLAEYTEPGDALVYDLHPWTPQAASTLLSHLDSWPGIRVLLYLPPRPEVCLLAPRFFGRENLSTLVQHNSPNAFELLCGFIGALTAREPFARIESLLTESVPTFDTTVYRFVREALNRLATPHGRHSLRVTTLAKDVGVTTRSLARALARVGSVAPKELLDWIILLFIAESAKHSGNRASHVAQALGYNANAFYRMKRRRLTPPDGELRTEVIQQELQRRLRAGGRGT